MPSFSHLIHARELRLYLKSTFNMAKVNDLQKFVNNARERKKNEKLASQIFQRNRRQSAPTNLKSQVGGSLASRVGIKKQRASLGAGTKPSNATGNVNGEWTHDLHNSVNHPTRGGSLASRITAPGGIGPNPRQQRAAARRAAALDRMDVDTAVQTQVNIRQAPPGKGMAIRGLAGPYTIMGENFAPGTTAADIESAMTPFGGDIESCRIVKTKPFIIVEMVFASREGGERVIETFNNKTADGRILKVYPKLSNGNNASGSVNNNQQKSTHAADQIVDGSMGFPDPNQRLYSDRMVNGDSQQQSANGNDRRGRRNQRGRGGR